MHIIIRKELKLFPYKIMQTPKFKPFDAERRVAFCNKMKQILPSTPGGRDEDGRYGGKPVPIKKNL